MNVPIRKFKAQLSRYIREATSGKDVVITSRGKPMVRLTPAANPQDQAPALSREDLVDRMKRLMPQVRIGTGKAPLGSARPIKTKPGQKTMAELIIEGRR